MILQPIRKMPNAFTRDEILCTFKYTFKNFSKNLKIQRTFKNLGIPY